MTSQSAFSEEEWFLVLSTPSMVGAAVAHAGRSGLGGTMKEVMANVRSMTAGKDDFPDNELIQALTAGEEHGDRAEAKAAMQEQMQKAQSTMAERGIKSPEALADAAVADCSAVIALLNERAMRSEVADYQTWIMKIAQNVSEAAKEGGFLGIGGERVSDAEEALIGRIQAALDTPAEADGFSGDENDGWSIG